jgi:uridylate kinase
MNQITYPKRILLKISGEALLGGSPHGIDFQSCLNLASALKRLQQEVQVALVIGGGNIFRGSSFQRTAIERTPADQIGMLATLMNGLALKEACLQKEVRVRVMTGLECPKVLESYNYQKAITALKEGELLIFVGGTGSPYFTTDTAAALRANEICADMLVKATKVQGVFDKDPKKNPEAKKFETLSFTEYLKLELSVMDTTAVALAQANQLPILVNDFKTLFEESPFKALMSDGTLIH